MEEARLELFWYEIPVGKHNAITYNELTEKWARSERAVRKILHDLSYYDNGDNYILIRSSKGKGFYRTDDEKEIENYKKECLNKGRSVFAPVKKINRVLNSNTSQLNFANNLQATRNATELKQSAVVKYMRQYDRAFDKSLLSKMENGVCLPTPLQLIQLARLYCCEPADLVNVDLYV